VTGIWWRGTERRKEYNRPRRNVANTQGSQRAEGAEEGKNFARALSKKRGGLAQEGAWRGEKSNIERKLNVEKRGAVTKEEEGRLVKA